MPADGSNQARLDIPACWILMIISTAGALVVGLTALVALVGKAVWVIYGLWHFMLQSSDDIFKMVIVIVVIDN